MIIWTSLGLFPEKGKLDNQYGQRKEGVCTNVVGAFAKECHRCTVSYTVIHTWKARLLNCVSVPDGTTEKVSTKELLWLTLEKVNPISFSCLSLSTITVGFLLSFWLSLLFSFVYISVLHLKMFFFLPCCTNYLTYFFYLCILKIHYVSVLHNCKDYLDEVCTYFSRFLNFLVLGKLISINFAWIVMTQIFLHLVKH